MITFIKLAAAGAIGLGILSPGFTPRTEDCECKAKADGALAAFAVPRADDCECKADASAFKVVPRAEDCECKAKAD